MSPELRARLSRWGRTPGVEPVVASALRARVVREPVRWLARDLAHRGSGTYRLRESGFVVEVEHATPDVHTLAEVWHAGVYAPPPQVPLGALPASPRLLDLGANVGMFIAWLAGRSSRPAVVAYEPDPRNAEVLRRVLLANSDRLGAWELRLAAAGASDRDVEFLPGAYTSSSVGAAGGPGRVVVRCRDVLEVDARQCDVLKMDIEGGEWELLRDARFAACSATVVAVEPHPTPDAPTDVVAGSRGLLEAAGYATAVVDAGVAVTVWGWRPPGR